MLQSQSQRFSNCHVFVFFLFSRLATTYFQPSGIDVGRACCPRYLDKSARHLQTDMTSDIRHDQRYQTKPAAGAMVDATG